VAIEPENEFVFEALPPKPAKFLNKPVGPTSAPIVSVLPDEFVTALFEENVSLKVTDNISPTLLALLSDENKPEELALNIEPLVGSSLLNSSKDGVNGLNSLLFASSTYVEQAFRRNKKVIKSKFFILLSTYYKF
jgi:hypothetical protein